MKRKNKIKNKKVFIGLSGGVDSSVSAALLKEEGCDVTGVFIKVWQPDFLECNWEQERLDAMRVCAILNIPFRTLDLENEYKKEVVDYMVSEYKKGRTPNPDVMCNRTVKFGGFLDYALEECADFVATGHYAVKKYYEKSGEYELHRGVDSAKDQSYFLWSLSQEKLKHALFPVGHMEKKEVRNIAKEFKLPTATKKDSQGLCFIGKIDLKEFLGHYISEKKGNVIDTRGKVIGSHDGAHLLTLGQRHGFTVTAHEPRQKPLYVVAKDINKNTVIVASKVEEKKRGIREVWITDVQWNSNKQPKEGKYNIQFRYQQEAFSGSLAYKNEGIKITFDEPQIGVSEGQSLVLYCDERCLGGGVIERSCK